MNRLSWFNKKMDYSNLLEHISMRDFDEFVINRYGDILVYRVYGKNENEYQLFAK